MKYQLTKHKELWDKIIAHLESMDFSMGFKPFDLLYTDYCLSMGLRHESYACEYAVNKAPYTYYMAHCKYCPAESCVIHKCGNTDCLYMKLVRAYINYDKANAINYARLIRDMPVKEGVDFD